MLISGSQSSRPASSYEKIHCLVPTASRDSLSKLFADEELGAIEIVEFHSTDPSGWQHSSSATCL